MVVRQFSVRHGHLGFLNAWTNFSVRASTYRVSRAWLISSPEMKKQERKLPKAVSTEPFSNPSFCRRTQNKIQKTQRMARGFSYVPLRVVWISFAGYKRTMADFIWTGCTLLIAFHSCAALSRVLFWKSIVLLRRGGLLSIAGRNRQPVFKDWVFISESWLLLYTKCRWEANSSWRFESFNYFWSKWPVHLSIDAKQQ